MLSNTCAHLLGTMAETTIQHCIFRDLVNTIYDLSVLADSGHFLGGSSPPVDILLFLDTQENSGDEGHGKELVLVVESVEACKILQSALLKTLYLWVEIRRLRQLKIFPFLETASHQPSRNDDSGFATFVWSCRRLGIMDESVVDLHCALIDIIRALSDESSYYDEICRFAACRLVQAFLHDTRHVEFPDLHMILDLATTVAYAARALIRRNHDTKVAGALVGCIEEIVSHPFGVDGLSSRESRRTVRRSICPILLETIPELPDIATTSIRRLGVVIISSLEKIFGPDSVDSLPVHEYTRASDTDVLQALFLLMQEQEFCEGAVWICSLVIDFANEAFGPFPFESMVKSIHEKYELAKTTMHAGGDISGLTRKRNRPDSLVQQVSLPAAKLIRLSEDVRVETNSGYRSGLLIRCITDLFSLGLVRCSNEFSSLDACGLGSISDFSTSLSAVIQLLAFSQTFSNEEVFGPIAEEFVSYLDNSIEIPSDRRRGQLFDVMGKTAEILRKKASHPVTNALARKLSDWADCFDISTEKMENTPKKYRPSFLFSPLDSDEKTHISRVRFLKVRSTRASSESDSFDNVLQSTIDILRQFSFEEADWLVRLLNWQLAGWLLHASSDIERDLSLAGDNPDFGASKLIKFLISTPFSDENDQVRTYCANELGRLMVLNKPLRAYLMHSGTHQPANTNSEPTGVLNLEDGLEQNRLFKEIDSLLHVHCRIPQSQLSFTVGLTLGSNSDDGKPKMQDHTPFQRSGIQSLASLLAAFFGTPGSSGAIISKNAFLRVIRLFVFFEQNQISESSAYTFGEMCRVMSKVDVASDRKFLLHTAPATFRDVLFPASVFFTCANQESSNPYIDQLERQCRLLFTLIEKFLSQGDFAEFDRVAGASVQEVEEFTDSSLPHALAQVVIEKDYDVLRSLTGFKRYAMSRRRGFGKKGKRSTFVTSIVESDLVVSSHSGKSKLWAHDLDTQTMELCTAPDIVERLVPLLLMHGGPDEDKFFTKKVLLNKLSLPTMLQLNGQIILKHLIMEFGENDEVPQAIWAMKRAAVARGLSQEEAKSGLTRSYSGTSDSNDESVSLWVSESFMHVSTRKHLFCELIASPPKPSPSAPGKPSPESLAREVFQRQNTRSSMPSSDAAIFESKGLGPIFSSSNVDDQRFPRRLRIPD